MSKKIVCTCEDDKFNRNGTSSFFLFPKFNNKYVSLFESQKKLLEKYIVSFSDNGVDFKVYLKEELSRILSEVKLSLKTKEVANDKVMVENTQKTISLIEKFNVATVGPKELSKILKLQSLSEEYKNNDD